MRIKITKFDGSGSLEADFKSKAEAEEIAMKWGWWPCKVVQIDPDTGEEIKPCPTPSS
jgi:hypothetical protein